jgi:AcrR family transcriptional regulator
MPLQQTRARNRHRRILDAALRIFSRRGYRDASVDEIADESKTSKGGVYFHFPGKEAIFLALLNRTAARLLEKIDEAMAPHDDPIAKADAALLAVLRTFAKHRALARLFMVEALGAGHEFHQRMAEIRDEFAAVIQRHLDEAIQQGVIEPIDTEIAGRAWFGALNDVITSWVLSGRPERLEDAYAALRPLLMRSVGIVERPRHLVQEG